MLEIADVSKSYGSLHVLTDVSLRIDDGEFVSIVGPSGAGKTTLLNIIGSLERPDSGRILFDSTDIVGLSDRKLAEFRNRRLGFVFQFHQLLPEFTLAENVALPAMIAGKSRRAAMARASELLGSLGLSGRLDHRPDQVSGGERQRAAVARALVNDPACILADEPSGSLDSHNREELYALFSSLREQTGKTLIVVTHDESLAGVSDRIIRMRDGRIVC